MVKLEALATFVAIVRGGSLSEAARRLHLSKSVVSGRLSDLEGTLGVRLVRRSTRQMTLTDEGAAYFEMAERVVHEIEEASAAVAARSGMLAGQLRVAAPVSFGVRHLGPALFPFLATHADLELRLVLNDAMVDLVGGGFDMAVRVGRLSDSALVARRLTDCRIRVIASPAYLERRGCPRTVAELEGHDIIAYSNMRLYEEWQMLRDGAPVTFRLRTRLQFNNGDLIRDAVAAGLGIAIMPTFLAHEALARGEVVSLRLDAQPASLGVFAVYPQNRHLSAKVRALADHLKQAFGAPPYWDAGLMEDPG